MVSSSIDITNIIKITILTILALLGIGNPTIEDNYETENRIIEQKVLDPIPIKPQEEIELLYSGKLKGFDNETVTIDGQDQQIVYSDYSTVILSQYDSSINNDKLKEKEIGFLEADDNEYVTFAVFGQMYNTRISYMNDWSIRKMNVINIKENSNNLIKVKVPAFQERSVVMLEGDVVLPDKSTKKIKINIYKEKKSTLIVNP